MTLKVVHEDARIIAVDKPTGMLTIPGRGEGDGPDLRTQVEAQFGAKVFVVHRLDRGASGLVVFAKDANSHKSLSMAFENRTVKKIYRALVQGTINRDGEVDSPLREFGSGRIAVSPDGKPSKTAYSIIEKMQGATLLKVEPETGRRHQIRVHLYSLAHPILGDDLYGKKLPVGGVPRLMLHAVELELPGKETLKLRAAPPEDFMNIVKKYRTA